MGRCSRPAASILRGFAVAAALAVSTAPAGAVPETPTPSPSRTPSGSAADALKRLSALAGEWQGTAEWLERTGRTDVIARYSTTGNGSAVVENLIMDGVPMMMTVYHADGPDLRMTHYCAARNQPRLKASRIDLANGAIDFSFVDATNLAAPDAPRVTGLEVRLAGDDALTLMFLFAGGGQPAHERISLRRAASKG